MDARLVDVLLFLPAHGNARPESVEPGRFQLITLECDVLEDPGFVELKVIGARSAPTIIGERTE
jgi:hypothetical protein